MKTLEDLKKLFPAIVELVESNNHEVGECFPEQDEDGWNLCSDYAENYISYEQDGWLIEVYYRCSGIWEMDGGDYLTPPSCDLIKAWGEVTEISATHYDENDEEDSTFTDEDVSDLYTQINEILKEI